MRPLSPRERGERTLLRRGSLLGRRLLRRGLLAGLGFLGAFFRLDRGLELVAGHFAVDDLGLVEQEGLTPKSGP